VEWGQSNCNGNNWPWFWWRQPSVRPT